MQYKILGDNMQALIISLNPGEEVMAEAGTMLYMSDAIDMKAQMTGGLLGGLKRKFLAGESLFMTHFQCGGRDGEVSFAAPYPGKIHELELGGLPWLCERSAFLCGMGNVKLDIAFTKRIGAGFFGGEGFILQKLSGSGTAFIHAGGNLLTKQLARGERLRVDTGCLVAFESTVSYDIKFVGGISNALFGGEGLFLAEMTGPGTVILQTLPFSRMADRVMHAAGAGKERGGLLNSILDFD